MHLFQCDLRSPVAKDNSIAHAAAAPRNLDAAIKMRCAKTQLQNTIKLRTTASEIAAPKPDLGNSSISTTCNAIYIARSIPQLQITMEFHRQLIQQHHLQSHLHCGNDPAVANHNGILSTTHARKTVDTPFTMRNRSKNNPNISEHDPATHETVSQLSHRKGGS